MQIIDIKRNSAGIKFSLEELIIINNSLNEVCYGIDTDESEIVIRMGAEFDEIDNLLKSISRIIEKVEAGECQEDAKSGSFGKFSTNFINNVLGKRNYNYNKPLTINYRGESYV